MPFASANAALCSLLAGKLEIIKLPWKPRMNERYWTFSLVFGDKWCVHSLQWGGFPKEYALLNCGWIYRTYEEAQAALPAVAKVLGVKYRL